MDSSSKDSIDGEQEEVVVTSSGISSVRINRKRIRVHGTEAGRHLLKGVIREEFQLEEEEEPEEGGVGSDV